MNKEAFEERAAELRELARRREVSVGDLEHLPQDDPIAHIGLLASKLGIDFGLAFDTSAQLEKGA